MLSRREADPGREVAAFRERLHRRREGGDRRSGDRSYTRYRRQPPRGVVGACTSAQFGIQARDLAAQICDLGEKQARQISHGHRQRAVVPLDDRGEAPDMSGTSRHDDALLGQMRA